MTCNTARMNLRTWREDKGLTLLEFRRKLPRRSQRIALSTISRIESLLIKHPDGDILRDIQTATKGQVTIPEMTPDASWAAYIASQTSREPSKVT